MQKSFFGTFALALVILFVTIYYFIENTIKKS